MPEDVVSSTASAAISFTCQVKLTCCFEGHCHANRGGDNSWTMRNDSGLFTPPQCGPGLMQAEPSQQQVSGFLNVKQVLQAAVLMHMHALTDFSHRSLYLLELVAVVIHACIC